MGCGGSKNQFAEIPVMDYTKLDRWQKFENQMFPFYRTRIDVFEGRVKRFVNKKSSVSLKQLRYAFKDDKIWDDIQNDNSLLVQVLKSDFFEDEENKGEVNLQALLLWGLLLCAGDNQNKSRVFYDILQDSL